MLLGDIHYNRKIAINNDVLTSASTTDGNKVIMAPPGMRRSDSRPV